jgi:hypothetical protein
MVQCVALFAAWLSVHAAEPSALQPIAIGGYRHYALLPVTAPDFKPPRGLIQNVSDRLLGRMLPLLNEWNDPEKSAAADSELAVVLVIDKWKGVSGGARAMWGALAGSSDMIAHVDLIERPSGKLIGRQSFVVDSKATWSASGTVSDYLMYDYLVNEVVTYLSSCHAVDFGSDSHKVIADPIKQ